MSIGRRWRSATFFVTSLLVAGLMTGCGDDPPAKEIQQAQQAINTARAAGADRYAPDEYTGALDALKRSQEAVAGKDYRQALNDALDARDRAQTAAKDATDRKSAARIEADRSLHDAALSLVDARAKLRSAETARRSQRIVAPVRRAIQDAETHVQEARTKFDSGDYLDAGDLLTKTRAELDESVRILEGAGRK